nr:MAG TPA: hypothetical protein [Caudoviricetes sp.]
MVCVDDCALKISRKSVLSMGEGLPRLALKMRYQVKARGRARVAIFHKRK